MRPDRRLGAADSCAGRSGRGDKSGRVLIQTYYPEHYALRHAVKQDYEGFHTRPMSWESVQEKFERLASPFVSVQRRQEIVEAVARLEKLEVRQLMELLAASLASGSH